MKKNCGYIVYTGDKIVIICRQVRGEECGINAAGLAGDWMRMEDGWMAAVGGDGWARVAAWRCVLIGSIWIYSGDITQFNPFDTIGVSATP